MKGMDMGKKDMGKKDMAEGMGKKDMAEGMGMGTDKGSQAPPSGPSVPPSGPQAPEAREALDPAKLEVLQGAILDFVETMSEGKDRPMLAPIEGEMSAMPNDMYQWVEMLAELTKQLPDLGYQVDVGMATSNQGVVALIQTLDAMKKDKNLKRMVSQAPPPASPSAPTTKAPEGVDDMM